MHLKYVMEKTPQAKKFLVLAKQKDPTLAYNVPKRNKNML